MATTTTTTTITVQTGNTQSGTYDVHQPLPYPFHCEAATGRVGRQDFWQCEVYRIVGFQQQLEVQTVDLFWAEAAQQPERMHGMFPVVVDSDGNLSVWTTPVTSTAVTAAPEE